MSLTNNVRMICLPQRSFTHWEDICQVDEAADITGFCNGEEVHVWQASLDASTQYYNLLSQEEKIKAGRFRSPSDQQRYIVSHGVLRVILSGYAGCNSSSIEFCQNRYGKPFLSRKNGSNTIRFNMTHSQEMACYIISKGQEVGIDIEYVHPDLDWLCVAKACFTPQEMIYLESLPNADQLQAFFILWTRKEALLKAIGTGLSGLEEMGASDGFESQERYRLLAYHCGDNYQGAIAIGSGVSSIRYFRFQT